MEGREPEGSLIWEHTIYIWSGLATGARAHAGRAPAGSRKVGVHQSIGAVIAPYIFEHPSDACSRGLYVVLRST